MDLIINLAFGETVVNSETGLLLNVIVISSICMVFVYNKLIKA